MISEEVYRPKELVLKYLNLEPHEIVRLEEPPFERSFEAFPNERLCPKETVVKDLLSKKVKIK